MTKRKGEGTIKGPAIRSAKESNRDIKGKVAFETVTCPTCKGSGRRGNGECGLCEGDKTIEVVKEKK